MKVILKDDPNEIQDGDDYGDSMVRNAWDANPNAEYPADDRREEGDDIIRVHFPEFNWNIYSKHLIIVPD